MSQSHRWPLPRLGGSLVALLLAGSIIVLALGSLTLTGLSPAAAAAMPLSAPPTATLPATPRPQPPTGEPGSGSGGAAVVEVLRLRVPAPLRPAWLEAERRSWEPWLQGQSGFLGRQLFWDPQREEATLLIHWASPQAWNAIPPAAVERVQAQFEALAAELSGEGPGNPFPLVFEGALLPQGGTIDVESDHLEQP